MCESGIAQIINDLESGIYPYPIFYSWPNCALQKWPQDLSAIPLAIYGADIDRTAVCAANNPTACPTPFWSSVVFPPNLRITFRPYKIDTQTGLPGPVFDKIAEFGLTHIFTRNYTSNIITNLGLPNVWQWYSELCNGLPNNCNLTTTPSNCSITDGIQHFAANGKLKTSMISCGNPLYPNFAGIRNDHYFADASFVDCANVAVISDPSDYCIKQGFPAGDPIASIELIAYQSVRSPIDNMVCPQTGTYFQSCSCLANQDEATNDIFGQEGDNCGVSSTNGRNVCGMCNLSFGPDKTCACLGEPTLGGSIGTFTLNFADDNDNVITWDELQTIWCTTGLTIASIPIRRYSNGSPACDDLMRKVCSNTAELTANPALLLRCGCILEQKRLEAVFAGINLPSQCFTSVCSLSNDNVYRTRQQLEGCSARLCTQLLQVHGSNILAEGVQQVVCNGELFNLTSFSASTDDTNVPFVSQVPANAYNAINLGPLFYISLVLLVIVLILVILWIVRGVRGKYLRQREERAFTFEMLNKS